MSKKALISVVVPVYKVEKYLKKCVDSVLAQTYQNFELFLVDDGSPDNCGKMCDEFAKNDGRIRVIHQKNKGLSAARNAGLKGVKGEFVAFIDSDDSVKKNYLEALLEAMSDDVDITVCGYNEFLPKAESLSGTEATKRLLIGQNDMDILAWNKLYRRSLFVDNDIEYPEGRIHEDNLTTYKLYAASRNVVYVAESLYAYLIRDNSITTSTTRLKQLNERKNAAREAEVYLRDNSELLKAAKIAYLLACFRFVDCALFGEIDAKYYEEYRSAILREKKEYSANSQITKKLRLYLRLIDMFNGAPYRIFRRIKK